MNKKPPLPELRLRLPNLQSCENTDHFYSGSQSVAGRADHGKHIVAVWGASVRGTDYKPGPSKALRIWEVVLLLQALFTSVASTHTGLCDARKRNKSLETSFSPSGPKTLFKYCPVGQDFSSLCFPCAARGLDSTDSHPFAHRLGEHYSNGGLLVDFMDLPVTLKLSV